MKRSWLGRFAGPLLVVALVGACASDDDAPASGQSGDQTTTLPDQNGDPTTTVADQEGGVELLTDELTAGVPDRPACASAEPTSAEGVTDDTVKLGALLLDLKKLADIGFAVDPGPTREIMRGLLEAPNATGGICGRKIEATAVSFDGLQQGADAQGCSQLTEDSRQFAVAALQGVSKPALSCLADQGKTTTLTDAEGPQSYVDGMDGRLFSVASELDAKLTAAAQIMERGGYLENAGKIGFVYGGGADNQELVDAMERNVKPTLEAAVGEDNVETCAMPAGAAAPEGAAALPLCVEQFASAGVKTVFTGLDIYSFTLFANEAIKQGLAPQYLNVGFGCCSIATPLFFHKLSQPENFDGLVSIQDAVVKPDGPYVDECLERVTKLGVDPAPADMSDFQQAVAVNSCFIADILLYGLAAAGPAPTEASFVAALEEMPPFANPSGFAGSFGPQKNFFSDELRLVTYDAAQDAFVLVSDDRYAIG
jgi:hypothetical protein